MRPRTSAKLDDHSMEFMLRRARSARRTASGIESDPGFAADLPEEIGLELTHRCNLRCAHCFQWGDEGFHHPLAEHHAMNDLDIGIVERILRETSPVSSDVYLWGGEPLVYSSWDALVELLAADPRVTVLCTNGMGLERRASSLARIGPGLTCLISVDGLREDNDSIRGKNTFRHALSSISHLLEMKKAGTFAGEVSVSAVLSAGLVSRLVEFVEFFDSAGINTLYLVFPWYIPEGMAARMDEYFASSFDWLSMPAGGIARAGRPSWHSYQFHLPSGQVPELMAKMAEIRARRWRIRVRFRPDVSPDEVAGFAAGSDRPAEARTRCLSVATRLSVLPDGQVTTCKLFPELAFGDLRVSSLTDLWHGEQARRARAILSRGLTPVCSKCVQLYLHGDSSGGSSDSRIARDRVLGD